MKLFGIGINGNSATNKTKLLFGMFYPIVLHLTDFSRFTLTAKTQIFFYFWVRKEAFVKAVGRGIGLGLNQCQLNPEDQDCFLSIPREYGFASDWKISEAKTGSDDVCAMVTKNLEFEYRQIK